MYRDFIGKGITEESIWKELKGQVFLGDKDFIEKAKSVYTGKGLHEVPRTQRHAARPSVAALFAGLSGQKKERDKAIQSAHFDHGYSLKEISDAVNLHYTTISKIINRTL